jgi:hypothetical protein
LLLHLALEFFDFFLNGLDFVFGEIDVFALFPSSELLTYPLILAMKTPKRLAVLL